MNFKERLAAFKPGFDAIPLAEKFRSAAAALAGTLLLGWALHFLPEVGYPLSLLASMAAAAVLLFAVPHSPMAQPWPLLVGNLLSGVVGWGCSLLIPDPVVAAACAVGLAVLVMHLTRSLHPPGAATAVAMVLNSALFQQHGWLWTASVVLANILLSLLLAFIINNLIHAGRYPVHRYHAPPKPDISNETLTAGDIEWALRQMEGVTDVGEDD
ncbi:MAG TPA: HPP family protein, partial [Gallionellaceae bacterium]|nr:HPP family protein [Gallionellaceae bacterium]